MLVFVLVLMLVFVVVLMLVFIVVLMLVFVVVLMLVFVVVLMLVFVVVLVLVFVVVLMLVFVVVLMLVFVVVLMMYAFCGVAPLRASLVGVATLHSCIEASTVSEGHDLTGQVVILRPFYHLRTPALLQAFNDGSVLIIGPVQVSGTTVGP
jgi:hypothetical protein